MFLNLNACYSPTDLVFIVALFSLTLVTIGSFTVLMIHFIKAALLTVKDLREDKKSQ
jgi:hypothetical protein